MTQKQAEKAAERAAAIFEEECKQGRVVDGNMSLSDYYHNQWSETRAVNLAPRTVKWYDDLFIRVDAHQLGKTPLKAINAHTLNTFYRYLREKCKKTPPKKKNAEADKPEPLSASTLNSYHRLLSSILTGAVRDGHIDENPCRKAEPPKVPQAEANSMQPEETQRLIAALASEPLVWRSLITAYIYTGARKSELLGCLWDDYNPDNGTLRISKQLKYSEGEGLSLRPTKTRTTRTVKLHPAMIPHSPVRRMA